MGRRPHTSQQALRLFAALLSAPEQWWYGVTLTRQTGLLPGTLYPLLIRLDAGNYLESRWEAADPPGRPPRHLYRLTPAGRALASERVAARRAVEGAALA